MNSGEEEEMLREPEWEDDDENFDKIYEENDQTPLNPPKTENVLMHLFSQISTGMDLSKVTLPTYILERRSLLEMYADFFAHPDEMIRPVDLESPEERFLAVVRYYLNSIYPARKSTVAKKPYNPVLGEVFRCKWDVPGLDPHPEKTKNGPFPGANFNQVTFIAEQVSHHPPVSAFYAEHPTKRVSFNAYIYTKSAFHGFYISVTNQGHGKLTLHSRDEEYIVTFPSGYGRSIFSTPWIELGGKIEVRCEKTGYKAEIEFLTKTFFGSAHKIIGNIYQEGSKKALFNLSGEWNGNIFIKKPNGNKKLFTDVRAKPIQRKQCVPISSQLGNESRRLWRHVTAALFHHNVTKATTAKRWIEKMQRDERKNRANNGTIWRPIYFEVQDNEWVFKYPLNRRT